MTATRFLILTQLIVIPWLAVRAQPVPLPDSFASAHPVSGDSWTAFTRISRNLASAEPGEPAHAGSPAVASQWVRVQYPEDGYVSLGIGPMRGFRLAVYTGDTLASLEEVTSVAVSQNRRFLGWEVRAGVTYSLAIDVPVATSHGEIHQIRGHYQRTFLRPLDPVLPARAPATVVLEAVSLVPDGEIQEVTFTLGPFHTETRTSPPWTVTVNSPAGGTLNVQARARLRGRLPFDLLPWEAQFLPPNDSWADSMVIPGSAVDWAGAGNTEFATSEPGEPEYAPGVPVERSVWWRWTPAFTGWTRISWQVATLQLYEGNSLASLVQLPDDPSRGFQARAGVPYAFRLAVAPNGPVSNTDITLRRPTLILQPPPGFLLETRSDGGLEMHLAEGLPHALGIQFLHPTDTFDSLNLELETPGGWETLATASGSPPEFSVSLSPGTIATVRIAGTTVAGEFRTSDVVRMFAAPPHDRFQSAVELPVNGTAAWDWRGLSLSGREPGEPAHDVASAGGSLWFRWNPAISGTGQLLLPGTAGPTTVVVYTGSALGSLQWVADATVSDADVPLHLPFPVTAGPPYQIAVVGAEPSQPASLTWVPVRAGPVDRDLRVGVPVALVAERFGGAAPAEVRWILNGGTLSTMTPNPTASDHWTPSAPGAFSLQAEASFGEQAVTVLHVSGWIRPANDRMVDAAPVLAWEDLPGFSRAAGDLSAATRELGEPSSFADANGTVWFTLSAPPAPSGRGRPPAPPSFGWRSTPGRPSARSCFRMRFRA